MQTETTGDKERANDMLVAAYVVGREDLRSFRETLYKVYGILVTAILALLGLGIQFSAKFFLVVPIPLAILFVASTTYLLWRGQLISVLAEIEREASLPPKCQYERIYREKPAIASPTVWAMVLSVAFALVVFYLFAIPLLARD